MKNTNSYDPADMLEQVTRVDAPPFLLTRIRQRIADTREQVSPAMAWVAGLSLVFILALNIYIITGDETTAGGKTQANLAQTMNLYPHNSLYE